MWTITTICTILKKLSEKDVGSDNPYLTTFLKHENVKSLDRGLLVELIDTIYVHDNNEITIQFNFADQHKRIVEFIENNEHNLELIKSNKGGEYDQQGDYLIPRLTVPAEEDRSIGIWGGGIWTI